MSQIISTIKVPVALAEAGGILQDFVWNSVVRGHKPTFSSDFTILHGLDANEQPTFAQLVAIVQNGGWFKGIRFGLQFTAAAANEPVPSGVPNSTITPEGEETRQKTWLEWITGNTQTVYRRVNGTPVYYVMKSAWNTDLLNSDQLNAARTTVGVTVIEAADLAARIASEDYELFEV